MNGAESLVKTLLNCGIDRCFANPGTSEMHFVAALDKVPGIKCTLGLQENVVTGMADGYYRLSRKPAATLLHCGPGLANGMANLHNARRARSAVVNIVGDQATYHRPHDAPLTADTEGMAGTVSDWVRTTTEASNVGRDAAQAVQAAMGHPGKIATLILPSDASWNEGGVVAEARAPMPPQPVDQLRLDEAARLLRGGAPTLLLLAGAAVTEEGQSRAYAIAEATGASLMADYMASHLERGQGRLPLARVPYVTQKACEALAPYKNIILINAKAPVGFFAYPDTPSVQHAEGTNLFTLSRPDQDAIATLGALMDAVGAKSVSLPPSGPRPEVPTGDITPETLAQTVAALMPENAIISDESISYGRGFYPHTYNAPKHDWLHLAGGAIGEGLPMATGAALGSERQRRVISLQADGSAMYSLQALWTQARENLPCTTIILSNRTYNILIDEYGNVGATPGQTAMNMLDLGSPDLDWVQLANGMGVEAARADSLETLADLMRQSFDQTGPFLIELMI